MAFDAQDRIFVSEWQNQRVSVFVKNGNYLTSFGTAGTGNGEFSQAIDAAVDPDGRVLGMWKQGA